MKELTRAGRKRVTWHSHERRGVPAAKKGEARMKFRVVAIQSNVTMVDPNQSEAEIKKVVRANLDRALELIDWAARESGPGPKLIVLPESFLHSFPRGTCPTMKKLMPMALSIPGEETKKLGEKAKEYQAYICGATYEYMEDWPGRIWNAGFIIDPSGNVALKRHKTASESGSGPVFVFNEYVERYGINAIYPVLDTPLGRLGVLICNEGGMISNSVENARCLALNGAEIICYPISTTSSDHEFYHLACRMRARDNNCYLVSANLGLTFSKERARASGGESIICDYEGRILTKSCTCEEATIGATFDVNELRIFRQSRSFILWRYFRPELFAEFYKREYCHPESKKDLKAPEIYGEMWESFAMGEALERKRRNLEWLYEHNILVRPDGGKAAR